MTPHDIQELLARRNLYEGSIDGVLGSLSERAIDRLLAKYQRYLPESYRDWPILRRGIAAGQIILASFRHLSAVIDGISGPITEAALSRYKKKRDGLEGQTTSQSTRRPSNWPSPGKSELVRFYGPAGGEDCTAGKVDLPFTMYFSWDKSVSIRRFSCHKKVADSLTTIFHEIADTYSEREIVRHGFNLYGGCYNFRKKRSGQSLSMHSWGIAVDLDPDRNKLRWDKRQAYFAKEECKEFWAIWHRHGWTGLGPEKDYDWMHIQATSGV